MPFDHAIVVGAGVGGLLAAAALAPRFGHVMVIERDELPAEAAHRRGVPQDQQMHMILAIGQDTIEELVPGTGADLAAAGAAWIDQPRDVAAFSAAGWAARGPSRARTYGIRRIVLEHAVRERVRSLPNVRFLHASVTGLTGSPDRTRVTGVALKSADPVDADLIVDSSGRTSHAPRWLTDLGWEPPAEQEIVSDLGYSTALVRLPEDALPAGVRGVVAPPHPENLHGAAVLPCDSGLHQIAALGHNNTNPPADLDGYVAHLAAAGTPIIAEVARRAEFVSPPMPYKVRGTRRRLWEDLPVHPDGFVALGDAVLALNPIYGQGMTVAALEALVMRDILLTTDDSSGVAGRIQESFRPTLDFVFGSVFRSDAQYAGTSLHGLDAPGPSSSTNQLLGALATEDWHTAVAVRYVGQYLTLDPLRRPEIQAKVRAWAARKCPVRNNDPRVIPPAFDGEPLPL